MLVQVKPLGAMFRFLQLETGLCGDERLGALE